MAIATVDPRTGETVRTFEAHDTADIERRLTRAASAVVEWRATRLAERTRIVARAGDILERESDAFARLMTLEMGKTLRSAREEAMKCAGACRWYAEHGPRFLEPETVRGEGLEGDHHVAYEPLGAVLAVMPWNFPFWQVIRFAAPALVAGNVGVLKHASNVPQCALALESLFARAGAPAGVFTSLLVGSDAVAGLIADPRIAAVTITGSERAGREVAAAAGRALKKTVLELGGSDAFVVMPSADLDAAVRTAVRARTINNGQSCIAAKRFIVADAIYDAFAARFVAAMSALKVGDPTADDTDIGPLATSAIRDELDAQVQSSVAKGARILTGGHPLPGPGFYYAPTVLADVQPGTPAYDEELFGPVATLLRAPDLDDAIRLANDTRFGLGAAAWTRDPHEMTRLTRELAAGTVFGNGMVASDPRFPFGGIKASGHGRELSGIGMREFLNVKTVRVVMKAADASGETE